MFRKHIEKDHRCPECSDWPYWLKIVLAYQIETKEEIMADIQALNDAVDALVAEEGSVKAALEDLSAKVAAGNSVSQADVDAITAKLTGVTDDMKSAVDANDPADAPVGTAGDAGAPAEAPAPMPNGPEVPGVPDNSFPATNQDTSDGNPAPADDNTEQAGGVVTDEPTVGAPEQSA